ncbi:hypothetical protein NBRC116586_02510 [Pseudooceanicola nitratireducens]
MRKPKTQDPRPKTQDPRPKTQKKTGGRLKQAPGSNTSRPNRGSDPVQPRQAPGTYPARFGKTQSGRGKWQV